MFKFSIITSMVRPMVLDRYLIAVIMMLPLSALHAGLPTKTPHPLILEEQECLKQATDSVALTECRLKTLKAWETEMNRVYHKLLDKIDWDEESAKKATDYDKSKYTKARKSLIDSQKAWLRFRDIESTFIDNYFINERGNILPLIRLNMLEEQVKSRTAALYGLLESKDMSGDQSKNYSFEAP